MTKWYVLHVQTGKELNVAGSLKSRGFSAVVPLENRVIRKGGKWIQKKYVVFSGYVFVQMDYDWNKYYAMSGISGIIKILGGGQDPVPLKNNEVEFIKSLSGALKAPSIIRFGDNGEYEIISGFLLTYKDRIVKIKRRNKKAEVTVDFAGESKRFTVSFTEEKDALQTPEQTED